MRIWLIFIPFLLFLFSNSMAVSYEKKWTEKKLGKVILKADKAARQKKWSRAIKYGEQAFKGSSALDQINDARYINQLKNINQYYHRAKRLPEVGPRVQQAYLLSREHLGLSHETTMISRNILYSLLVGRRDFSKAIPLILENLNVLKDDEDRDFKKLHHLKQLFSLYALTRQYEKEENILVQYLALNKKLFGKDDESLNEVVVNLARNYCRQKKITDFRELTEIYDLKYSCE